MNRRFASCCLSLLFLTAGILAEDEGVCKNDGSPQTGTHQKCQCAEGFKGFDCSEKIKACDGAPCRNSAACVDNEDDTFTCKCQPNYEGILCEKKVRPCDRTPCKNGGECSDDGVKCFKCECPDGFKGFDCSQKVSPCEVSPCQNGAVCSDLSNGKFSCNCTSGYAGLVCDRKEPLYKSNVVGGNDEWIKQLEEWLPSDKQDKDLKLCYRATENGWASTTFHSLCDNKGPTIVLVKSGVYIFGGYAGKSWGGSTRFIKADDSFIFSFRNRDGNKPFKSLIYQNEAKALYTAASYGPTFGGGHDFYIANNAITGAASYTNFGYTYKPPFGYGYNTVQAKNLLAGTYNFKPNEVEVYYFE